MGDSILENRGANFYGYESIDSSGKHHYHLAVVRGSGDLFFTKQGIHFNQWITKKEHNIPLEKITKVEIKTWHNMKMKWPAKVLRIFFRDQNETKIFGVALGGKLSITKGWKDDAYLWKEKIESKLNEKF